MNPLRVYISELPPVDSCRLGLCLKCGTPWPRHSVPGCTGTYPRIMEHRTRVEAVSQLEEEDPVPPLQTRHATFGGPNVIAYRVDVL